MNKISTRRKVNAACAMARKRFLYWNPIGAAGTSYGLLTMLALSLVASPPAIAEEALQTPAMAVDRDMRQCLKVQNENDHTECNQGDYCAMTCTEQLGGGYDAKLNQVYKSIREQLHGAHEDELLVASERAWIKQKKQNCDASSLLEGEGQDVSGRQFIYYGQSDCEMRETWHRLQFLKTLASGYNSSETIQASIKHASEEGALQGGVESGEQFVGKNDLLPDDDEFERVSNLVQAQNADIGKGKLQLEGILPLEKGKYLVAASGFTGCPGEIGYAAINSKHYETLLVDSDLTSSAHGQFGAVSWWLIKTSCMHQGIGGIGYVAVIYRPGGAPPTVQTLVDVSIKDSHLPDLSFSVCDLNGDYIDDLAITKNDQFMSFTFDGAQFVKMKTPKNCDQVR